MAAKKHPRRSTPRPKRKTPKTSTETTAPEPASAKGKRRFQVIVTCRVELDLDQAVIDSVDDGWRKRFYGNVRTPEEIAGFIGSLMVREDVALNFIDGFADQPRAGAIITDSEWDFEAKENT